MRELFASGHAVDVVLAVVAVEVALLAAPALRRRFALSPLDWIGQVLAGVFLLGAVRCALTGADHRFTAAMLLASLPAHLFDMGRRFRSRRIAPGPAAQSS